MSSESDAKQDTMPIKAFRSLLRVVSNHGYNVEEVLETIGLDFNPMSPAYQHIASVPTRVYSRLYRHLMILLQDEAFGMMLPDRAPPGTFRMMCLFIIHCKSLRDALERSAQFFDYCDSFHQRGAPRFKRNPVTELRDQGLAQVRFNNPNLPADGQHFATDASVMFMMYRFFSWLTGQPLSIRAVHFITGDPAATQQYEPLFDAPVRLQQRENCLLLPLEALTLPVVQTEKSLQEFLKTAPYPLISRVSSHDGGELKEKVKAIFNAEFGHELPSAENLAQRLNMSVRTLHRHLQKDGTSYQILKDEFRKEAVLSYMSRPELSISAIAILMGFQDSSAFHRSFRKWTGISPGAYRKRLREKATR